MKTAISEEAVRSLVVARPQDVESVAKKLRIDPSYAKGMRLQWTRRFQGKCVLCGMESKRPTCKRCRSHAMDQRTPVALLQRLDPTARVFWASCSECKEPFEMTVGLLLKAFNKRDGFEPPTECKRCISDPALTHQPFRGLKVPKSEKQG